MTRYFGSPKEEAMETRLKRTRLWVAFVGIFAAVLAGTMLAQPTDPQVGTWKLNLAKSKYEPGPSPQERYHKDRGGRRGNEGHR